MSPTTSPSSFTVTTPTETDLWRKPPSHNATNAPIKVHSRMPLTSFRRVQVSISADYKQRYDQGGFVLRLTHPDKQDKWLKAGVEFFNGKPMVSTVGTWAWSDWSVAPVVTGSDGEWVTVEAVRQGDELGSGLWVYQVVRKEGGGEEKVPLRECGWFFAEEGEGWEVEVGAYAAKPASEGGELVVRFKDMMVEKVEG